MAVQINGQTFYRSNEACRLAGTSKNTYLNWVRQRKINDVELRDRRGWRLFSESDLQRLKDEVNRVIPNNNNN